MAQDERRDSPEDVDLSPKADMGKTRRRQEEAVILTDGAAVENMCVRVPGHLVLSIGRRSLLSCRHPARQSASTPSGRRPRRGHFSAGRTIQVGFEHIPAGHDLREQSAAKLS